MTEWNEDPLRQVQSAWVDADHDAVGGRTKVTQAPWTKKMTGFLDLFVAYR